MTPTTTAPPPPQSVQTQQGQLTQQAALGALTVALLSGLSAAQLGNVAEALLTPFGLSAVAIRQVVGLTAAHALDLPQTVAPGSAAEQMARLAAPHHATYLFNAAKRLTADPGSLATERRYFTQHLAAARGRREAATKTDAAALRFGALLGWHTQGDGLVEVECRRLESTNFTIADPPRVHGVLVLPGTLHGGTCRCFAGPPHPAGVPAVAERVAAGASVGALQ